MVHPAPTLIHIASSSLSFSLSICFPHFKVNPGQEEPNVSQDAERAQENLGEQNESSAFLHSPGMRASRQ